MNLCCQVDINDAKEINLKNILKGIYVIMFTSKN